MARVILQLDIELNRKLYKGELEELIETLAYEMDGVDMLGIKQNFNPFNKKTPIQIEGFYLSPITEE